MSADNKDNGTLTDALATPGEVVLSDRTVKLKKITLDVMSDVIDLSGKLFGENGIQIGGVSFVGSLTKENSAHIKPLLALLTDQQSQQLDSLEFTDTSIVLFAVIEFNSDFFYPKIIATAATALAQTQAGLESSSDLETAVT